MEVIHMESSRTEVNDGAYLFHKTWTDDMEC